MFGFEVLGLSVSGMDKQFTVLTVTCLSKIIFGHVHKEIYSVKEILKPTQGILRTLALPVWAIAKAHGDSSKFKIRFWHS